MVRGEKGQVKISGENIHSSPGVNSLLLDGIRTLV